MSIINLAGQRFGRLEVVSLHGRNRHHDALWLCNCDCGNTKIASIQHLKGGWVKSCGCLERDRIEQARTLEAILFGCVINIPII